jgi:hypothetical protein
MNTMNNELARFEAQRLAFSPLVFQACRVLRDVGVLEQLAQARARGVNRAEAATANGLSPYASSLLLEAGYAGGLCICDPNEDDPRFTITSTGLYWLRDPLTRVNAEFNHHVCYKGAFHMRDALLEGRPAGLPEIDTTGAGTVYEALHALPTEVRRAWFDFDHYYSDGVFEACLPRVLENESKRVVDIGGNTGRFASLCLARSSAEVTLVDLPQQLAEARTNLASFGARARFVPLDVRNDENSFPAGADAYWLSQFLDCFGEAEILSILTRVRQAMAPHARVFILETYWDQQRYDAARFCVIGTSLYFACIANGNSRMYHSAVMKRLIAAAGLKVSGQVTDIGISHTLLICEAA